MLESTATDVFADTPRPQARGVVMFPLPPAQAECHG